MSLGQILMRLTSKEDPAAQLAAALAPMQPGAAPQGVPAAAAGGGGAAAPAGAQAQPAPPPSAPASPPDLMGLYTKLMDRDRNARNIDSSLGLIASAFVEDKDKDRISKAFGDGKDNPDDPSALINNMMALRNSEEERNLKMKAAAQQQAARLATLSQLPNISRRTGVPTGELEAMLNAGTLGAFLGKANERGEYDETKDAATGQTLYVNKLDPTKTQAVGGAAPAKYTTVTDGTGQPLMVPENDPTAAPIAVGAPTPVKPQFQSDGKGNVFQVNANGAPTLFGEQKPDEMEVRQDGTGMIRVFNPRNLGEGVQSVGEPTPAPDARTVDQKDYDRDMAGRVKDGRPLVPFDQWRQEDANLKKPGVVVNNGNDPRNAAFAKTWADQYDVANASTKTVGNMSTAYNALKNGIIEGSVLAPLELTTRKLAGSIFGLDDATVNNTELYQSAMGSTVLTLVKELGTGNSISNADRDFAAQIAGGNIALDGKSMQQIIRMQEKNARGSILKYNQDLAEAMKKDPTFTQGRMVELPPPSRALLDVAENAKLPDGSTAVQRLREDVAAVANDPVKRQRELEEFNREFGPGMAEYLLGGQ